MRRHPQAWGSLLAPMLCCLVGCQAQTEVYGPPSVSGTVPRAVQIPPDVSRLAVLYRATPDRDEREAYRKLEGAAFQLKEVRPMLKIFERADLSRVLAEQRFQVSGPVTEDTAVRVGRLLGVDSVLVYEIQGPSLRDQIFARRSDELPPLLLSSKIIKVESAEIVFHNVVTAPIEDQSDGGSVLESSSSTKPFIRAALDRGVNQTIADLRRAFR